ncbi:MAG: lasso peptide biosynthesis protein [Sphingomonas phyllosphaerae]
MMWIIAKAARSFLRPHWRRWHETWGPPVPQTLSQWTCVRSSLMLTDTFNRRGISATLRSGRGNGFGIRVAGCWESHAWVEADGQIVDITADQFGYAPVIVARFDHPVYRAAQDSHGQLAPSQAAVDAVAEVWPAWCGYLTGASV